MKKIIVTVSIVFLYLSFNIAQIPKEAFEITNSLSDLWQNGDTKTAVESSIKLYDLYRPFLLDNIHNSLAQKIIYGLNENVIDYLDELYKKNNEGINEVIAPIYLWSKAINTNNTSELKTITDELIVLLGDSANYDSRAERYSMLILKELENKKVIDDKTKEKIININIRNLENYPFIDTICGSREARVRSWHRYVLAYTYYFAYSSINNHEEYLKKASYYSPDLPDRQSKHIYFYDAVLFGENKEQIGFRKEYQKYLADRNRTAEALSLLCEITFYNPSNENVKTLQDYYIKTNSELTFIGYWEDYIHNMGKPVPMVKIKYENEELDLTKEPGQWIYIDVWGTWCSPCREELPGLQSFFEENQKSENSNLKIYTFSFASQKLADFMKENNYTFPVSEIDQPTNDAFDVTGYPTKILISPKGNYINIPFGVDWRQYVKNYTLM